MDVPMWLTIVISACGFYVLIGFMVALALAVFGIGKLDPSARDGTWGFRMLVIPGLTALWPLFLWRWIQGAGQPPMERNAHRREAASSPTKEGTS